MMDEKFYKNMSAQKPNYLVGFLIFFLMRPYFTWTEFFDSNYVRMFACLIIGVCLYKNKDKGIGTNLLLSLFITISVLFVFTSGYDIKGLLLFVPLAFIPFANEKYMSRCLEGFLNIYTCFLFLSLISWVFMILGILHPYTTIKPLNDIKSFDYNVYPLLVQSNDLFHPDQWFRFHGIFDEPGVVGTISGLLLCIKSFDFKDFRCVILLISGLCSVSLFFFLLIAIYAFVFYSLVKGRLWQTILFVIFAALVYILTQTIPELYDAIGFRFEWDSDSGSLAGDNRISDVGILYFLSSIGTSEFWFGVTNKQSYLDMVEGSSSIINVIMINGMVFLIIYFLFFLIYSFRKRTGVVSSVLFFFVFLATLYQRPNIFNAEYIFLWSCLACFGGNNKLQHTEVKK